MLNDIPNVMTELAPKGPTFVEIIEIMDSLDIPFIHVLFLQSQLSDHHFVLYTLRVNT